MITIESILQFVSSVYEVMERNVKVVREKLSRPLTLADKVLLSHLDDPANQEMNPGQSYLLLRPDRVILQDVLGQIAMLQFMQTRRDSVDVPTTIHCDYLIQARVEGRSDLKRIAGRVQRSIWFPVHRRGSLEVGKQADLMVLSGNPLTCPEDEIKDLPVDLTIVGGRIVHEHKSGAPGGSQ